MMEQNEHIKRINQATNDGIEAILNGIVNLYVNSVKETIESLTPQVQAELEEQFNAEIEEVIKKSQ